MKSRRIRNIRLIIFVVLFITSIVTGVFPMGGKESKMPMKPTPVIGIPDGEFLHYTMYDGGEKWWDTYYVTRKKTEDSGKVLYHIYSDTISVTSGRILSNDYTSWPTRYVIDPVLGSVLEAEQYYLSGDSDEETTFSQFGMGNISYTHYLFHQDEGYVEYIIKSKKDEVENESKYRVKVKTNQAIWEGTVSFYFAPRFMDIHDDKGVFYMVIPQFMKEPLPNYYKIGTKETMKTGVGMLNVFTLNTVMADPFIGKLMKPLVKGGGYWVEESERKIIVKVKISESNETVIEEISTVDEKFPK